MKLHKIYFFDIDGTIAESKKKISAKISNQLSQLSKKKKVAIISGASLKQINQAVVNKLKSDANLENLILLPTSGAALYIYEENGWKEIYNKTICKKEFEKISELIISSFRKNKVPIPRKCYGERIEYRGSQITFSAHGQKAPLELKEKWDPDHKKRDAVIKTLNDLLPEYEAKIGGTSSIDINLKGIDKQYGIEQTLDYLNKEVKSNIKKEEAVFFGDKVFPGGNDYPAVLSGTEIISVENPTETENILDKIIDEIENGSFVLNLISLIVLKIKKLFCVFSSMIGGIFVKCLVVDNQKEGTFKNKWVQDIDNKKSLKKKTFKTSGDKENQKEFHDNENNIYITRFSQNPVLSPTSYSWENEGAFNPAAIYLGGRVHLLYRAMGSNGVSTIGYASSEDGINFDDRLPYPVYYPKDEIEIDPQNPDKNFNPDKYASGGGWSGCEDPKISKIGDRLFLTYVAFSGWKSVRVALTSISVSDFLEKKWNWTRPILCSPKCVISKSGGLFPEKIRGKYVFFQRIFPNILIDYFDNLRFDDPSKKQGEFEIGPQKTGWDSRKISFGSTPIKTNHGWLVITHGVDDKADEKYHMGAMLLDLKNPEKVLYRSKEPILSPELWYENDWKPGILYPCGAVNKDGTLLVYYGGGDKYVCVATAEFDKVVESLLNSQRPKMKEHYKLKIRKK